MTHKFSDLQEGRNGVGPDQGCIQMSKLLASILSWIFASVGAHRI